MLRLAEMYLQDDLQAVILKKWKQYAEDHPDEKITLHDFAKMLLEYGIRYLDISALDQ